MSQHRRRYARHAISLVVDLRLPRGWVPCKTGDVSRRGLFLKAEQGIEVGQLLQVRVKLPHDRPIALLCQVRRRSEEGIGVDFMPMPQQLEDRWDRFVLGVSRTAPSAQRIEEQDNDNAFKSGVNAPPATPRAPRTLKAQVDGQDRDEQRLVNAETINAKVKPAELRLRPDTEQAIEDLCDALTRDARLNLWFSEQVWPGQAVRLVLIHPVTDAECVLEAACSRCGHPDGVDRWPAEVAFAGTKAQRRALTAPLFQRPTQGQPLSSGALIQAQTEVESDPTQCEAHLQLGWATLAVQKDPAAAAASFQQALTLSAGSREAHWALVAAYALMGQQELAYRYAKAAFRAQEQAASESS